MVPVNPAGPFVAKGVYECWRIASDDADRYQDAMNRLFDKHDLLTSDSRVLWNTLRAKRDAASHIARLIRFGQVDDPAV